MKRHFALLFLTFLSACVVQRSVVRQPDLILQVTDGSVPLANSSVYLYWLSNPHSRLEESQMFTTDRAGNLQLGEVLQRDTAYPLAMHGVSYFEHKLCIEAEGYRTLLVTLAALPGDEIRLDVPLTEGSSVNVCNTYERLSNHPGVPRPDIASQHVSVRGAYEITSE